MTLDGICDHTAGVPDAALHRHYTGLLERGDAILYGRITYELMEFWRTFPDHPSEEKSMNDFAAAIGKIPKIVFSTTLKTVNWSSAVLAQRDFEDELAALRQQPGNDIFIGSRSLIIQAMNLNLIDELQICIHPVIEGKGLRLFDQVQNPRSLKLVDTKRFESGAIVLYYRMTSL